MMLKRHNELIGFGSYFQRGGESFWIGDEGVVTHNFNLRGEVLKNYCFGIEGNFTGFSVNWFRSTNNFSAKSVDNCLMPQTNSEDGNFIFELINHFTANTNVAGIFW